MPPCKARRDRHNVRGTAREFEPFAPDIPVLGNHVPLGLVNAVSRFQGETQALQSFGRRVAHSRASLIRQIDPLVV